MSLRFLTKRRDRDRDLDRNRSDSSNKPDPLRKSPSTTPCGLPFQDSFVQRNKAAAAPSEIQIISWNPDDLRTSGRDVHIRSREEEASSSSATPVHAFTARPASASRFMTKQAGSSSSIDHDKPSSSASSSDIGHTFFGAARDLPVHRSHDSTALYRARPGTAPLQRKWAASPVPLDADPASDTPKSEDVEILNPSFCALPHFEQQESASERSFNGRPRHGKSYSHASAVSRTADVADTLISTSSSSRLPFSAHHRNASVQSLASLISVRGPLQSQGSEANTSSNSSASGLLSRLPSLRRTKSKNALVAGSHRDTSFSIADEVETRPEFRSRSESFGSLTTKLFRPAKESLQAPSTTLTLSKASRGTTAPPSAWRTDVSAITPAAAAEASPGNAYGMGRAPSLTYSSDNEMSVGPGSSSDHGRESSGGGPTSYRRHYRTASSSDTSTATTATTTISFFAGLKTLGGGGGGSSNAGDLAPNRISAYSTRSDDPPAHTTAPLLHFDQPSPVLDSPQVTGLPLPLPSSSNPASSPGGTVFTAQLLQRIGPPPVGLSPECFHERVTLIQNYVVSQVPPSPALPPSPLSFPSEEDLAGTSASNRHPLQRPCSALPHRRSGTVFCKAQPPTSLMPGGSAGQLYDLTAALQDEFDKLECLAERELGLLAGEVQRSSGARPVEVVAMLQGLRLEEAFLEARSRSGVDCSRSHFDLHSLGVAGDMARLELARGATATAMGQSGNFGLGLRGITPQSPSMGSVEMSLKPAPRKRRGTASAKTPTTAAADAKPAYVCPDLPAAIQDEFEGELFTPQSFSSQLRASQRASSHNCDSHSTSTGSSSGGGGGGGGGGAGEP